MQQGRGGRPISNEGGEEDLTSTCTNIAAGNPIGGERRAERPIRGRKIIKGERDEGEGGKHGRPLTL